jgi:hypothetical protein
MRRGLQIFNNFAPVAWALSDNRVALLLGLRGVAEAYFVAFGQCAGHTR